MPVTNIDKWHIFEDKFSKKREYSTDGENVFYKERKITESDPITISTFNENYAYDKNNVYNSREIIKNTDPKTFVLLQGGNAKDKN